MEFGRLVTRHLTTGRPRISRLKNVDAERKGTETTETVL